MWTAVFFPEQSAAPSGASAASQVQGNELLTVPQKVGQGRHLQVMEIGAENKATAYILYSSNIRQNIFLQV